MDFSDLLHVDPTLEGFMLPCGAKLQPKRRGSLPFVVALGALMRSSDDVLDGVDFGLVDHVGAYRKVVIDAYATRKGNRQLL